MNSPKFLDKVGQGPARNRPGTNIAIKVVRDPCQKITLLLLKSKSVRVIVPEPFFKREYLFSKTVDIILP